jgi:hypothetical protein
MHADYLCDLCERTGRERRVPDWRILKELEPIQPILRDSPSNYLSTHPPRRLVPDERLDGVTTRSWTQLRNASSTPRIIR